MFIVAVCISALAASVSLLAIVYKYYSGYVQLKVLKKRLTAFHIPFSTIESAPAAVATEDDPTTSSASNVTLHDVKAIIKKSAQQNKPPIEAKPLTDEDRVTGYELDLEREFDTVINMLHADKKEQQTSTHDTKKIEAITDVLCSLLYEKTQVREPYSVVKEKVRKALSENPDTEDI